MLILGAATAWLLSLPAAAGEPLERSHVPAPLAPWVDWVLHDHPDAFCPFLHASPEPRRPCAWPGLLTLSLDDSGGRYTQDFRVYAETWVQLPGEAKHWPASASVDGKPAPVIARDGVPALRLAPGAHAIAGAFRWSMLPEILAVPPETGLIALTLRGRAIEIPNRDEEGRLWLQRGSGGPGETRLEVIVHRLLDDSVPIVLSTRIVLKVSGQSREVVLARALPDAFVPMSLSGSLPARLDPDGRLRVQVRPGTFPLEIVARHDGPAEKVSLLEPQGLWDLDEAWAFRAHPELREVAVESAPLIDPGQTEMPEEWKGLPTYLMKPGDTMRLAERRRGDSDPAPDRLALDRTWWLDFDGGGYTLKDRITGTFHRSWRLEMGLEVSLGRVSMAAEGQKQEDQYINAMSPPGVEVRVTRPVIEADSRIEGARFDLPAIGWLHDFESVAGRIELPPGWRLIHAFGVDRAEPTWVTEWDLLDDFLVLMLVISIGRLFGWRAGLLALITLALAWQEPWAPRWSWLFVVIGEALFRAISTEGRLKRFVAAYRSIARGALAIVVLVFMVLEARASIYPQLEDLGVGGIGPLFSLADRGAASIQSKESLDRIVPEPQRSEPHFGARAKKMAPQAQQVLSLENAYAPDVRSQVTTGPGLPTWRWRNASLSWRGPVDASQRLQLLLAPPWLTRTLGLVTAVLTALLALLALGAPLGAAWRRPFAGPRTASSAVLIAALCLPAVNEARAEESNIAQENAPPNGAPSAGILAELASRLLAPPSCAPSCADSPRLLVELAGTTLRLRFDVTAAAVTAVPLPGGAQQWTPSRVILDRTPAKGLLRTADGVLWIPLETGAHEIVLESSIIDRDTIEIPLPLRPHRVEGAASGFTLAGVREDGVPEDTLVLTRTRTGSETSNGLEPGRLPPFVVVTREISLGLSWQVFTRVERKTPPGAAIVLEVPLVPGESVTTAEVRVENGRALVSMGPNTSELTWTSVLGETRALSLKAPSGVPWVEIWRANASPVWHLEPSGIAPVHAGEDGPRIYEWRPWAGESLTLAITRPPGVPGQTTTIDSASLTASPGLRATDATLAFGFRSSRGGERTLKLPEGATLQSVTVDGSTQPVRQQGRELTVPVSPGSHQIALTWRQPGGIATIWRTPEVHLGLPSVNTTLTVEMPHDRWALALRGPTLGPAILFWSLLAVFFVTSLGLGRIRWTPLRARHWFLLLIGLTQVPIPVSAIVIGWLVALGHRKEKPPKTARAFRWTQVALALLTLGSLACLAASIAAGLLGDPEMQIAGNGSYATHLSWYEDRSSGDLPRATVLSVPLAFYRIAMLAWALWLAISLTRWLKWGWACFTTGGLWPERPPRGRPEKPERSGE